MGIYLEYLTGDPICIIRSGPTAERYGVGGYDFAAVVDVHRPTAIIKALITTPPKCEVCEWHKRLKMSQANDAFDVIRRELNAEPDWERFK